MDSQTQLTGHWVKGVCTKAKWSFYDSQLDQNFLPFVADVDLQKAKVVKYLPTDELKPKAIFKKSMIPSKEPETGDGSKPTNVE